MRYDIASVSIDVVAGAIIGWFISAYFGGNTTFFTLFGIFAALAPDIDFIIHLYRNDWTVDKFAHEHRDLFHNPLLISFVGGYILFILAGSIPASIWIFATLGHFIHDTLSGGWGVRWLYPLYLGYFTLVKYSPQRIIRNREEQRKLATLHGTSDWMDHNLIPFASKKDGSGEV